MIKGIFEALSGNLIILWVMFFLCPVYLLLGNLIANLYKSSWIFATNKQSIIYQTVGDISWLFPFAVRNLSWLFYSKNVDSFFLLENRIINKKSDWLMLFWFPFSVRFCPWRSLPHRSGITCKRRHRSALKVKSKRKWRRNKND